MTDLDCRMYEKKKARFRAMLCKCNKAVLLGKTGLMLISLMSGKWDTVSSLILSSLWCLIAQLSPFTAKYLACMSSKASRASHTFSKASSNWAATKIETAGHRKMAMLRRQHRHKSPLLWFGILIDHMILTVLYFTNFIKAGSSTYLPILSNSGYTYNERGERPRYRI